MPLLVSFHLFAVAATIWGRNSGDHRSIKAYISPMLESGEPVQQRHGVCLTVLWHNLKPTYALGVCGILLTILNLTSDEYCHSFTSCSSDPLIQTTAVAIAQHPSAEYQCCWVVLSCATTAIMMWSVHRLRSASNSKDAKLLYSHIELFVAPDNPLHIAIEAWHQKAQTPKASLSRRIITVVLTIPLMALAASPAVAYVFSQKYVHPNA